MKKIYLFISSILLTVSVVAQAPDKMSYQAVIRDVTNTLVTSQTVGMQISVIQGSTSGTVEYIETQTPSTNTNGLATIEIGGGTVVSGTFPSIDWANGPYFIKIETDPTGGTNYSITGISQLLSVPYALYAENSGSPGPQGPIGPTGPQGTTGPQGIIGNTGIQGTQGVSGPIGLTGATGLQGSQGIQGNGIVSTVDNGDGTLTFTYTDASTFTSPNLQGPQGVIGVTGVTGPQGIIGNTGTQGIQGIPGIQGATAVSGCNIIKSGDGRIVIYSSTDARGFGKNFSSGSGWYSTPISGTFLGAVASDSTVVIYTNTMAYGFGFGDISGSKWSSIALSNPPTGFLISSGRIVLYNATDAYGFGYSNTSGTKWYSRVLSGGIIGSTAAGNRIVLYNTTDAYGFGFGDTSGSKWYNTPLVASPIDIIGTE